ncbi:c-type cytochrome [Ramlibacter rhizophilus]|uniref:Cytochrome c n=1 Tax=Ramlibacter rhizophilus TaxID=1781167 RepID=A0A4Z0C4F5_9BURK|nr:cytochrome c [Ramlibacter rhizophilus]TFZ05009.1 cytochrome c [Ramlibacter rhizophilus]
MKQHSNKLGLGIFVGAFGLVVLMGLAGLAVVYTGAYNVAATEEHLAPTRWALATTMHRSVRQRAEEARGAEQVPPAMLAAGARAYHSMCQHCHAGPGVEREPWADGMRPRPPHLTEAATEWEPGEIFWIVRHGIKMTGMPAFGPTHDDEAIRGIAAFVKALPAMTPERYAQLGARKPETPGGHDHGPGAGGQAPAQR